MIKKILYDFPQCLLATFLMALGVSIFVECRLGSDTVTVFLDGMNQTFGFPISLVDQILVLVLLIFTYILNKDYIGISTILCVMFIGTCLSITNSIIELQQLYLQPFLIRCIWLFIGQVLICLGSAIMIVFSSGMSVYDAFIYSIMDKFHLSYILVSFLYGAGFMITGIMLKGIIGIGTIVSLVSGGPITEIFKRYLTTFKIKNGKSILFNKEYEK